MILPVRKRSVHPLSPSEMVMQTSGWETKTYSAVCTRAGVYFFSFFHSTHQSLSTVHHLAKMRRAKNDIFPQSSWGSSAKKMQEEFCPCSKWSSGNGKETHQKEISPTCFVIVFCWKPRLLTLPCATSRDLEPRCWNQTASFCHVQIYLQSLSVNPDVRILKAITPLQTNKVCLPSKSFFRNAELLT